MTFALGTIAVVILRCYKKQVSNMVLLYKTLIPLPTMVSVLAVRVREALASGNLAETANLLGRPYRMSGRVAYGRQLGRTINTPTANIMVKRLHLPLSGVFAVKVQDEHNGKQYTGVASLGIKPTISDTPEPSLEVHLFDVNSNLYHRHFTVEFIEKIRDEQKFNGLDELKAAIDADKQTARQILSRL